MKIVVPDTDQPRALLLTVNDEEAEVLEDLFDCGIAKVCLGHIGDGDPVLILHLKEAPRHRGRRLRDANLEWMWGRE